ncbi:MAG: hypothetical protein LBE18_02605 [Planctomycetaceae bacterium]|jgi:hypothetical protein|nr:hypothetical protein [Planctomycetaceae bacterium]
MLTQKRFLFRFKIPCGYIEFGKELDESYRLPDLSLLELSSDLSSDLSSEFVLGSGVYPDFRVGWNERGISFAVRVRGKKQMLWCKSLSPYDSDGVQIYIDTRDMKDIHRATRFCHRLIFLPVVNDGYRSEPCVFWLPIHRAKSYPNPIDAKKIKLANKIFNGGYDLKIFVPQEVLTGFDPIEYPALGFHFVVVDRELGNRYFLVEPPFPYDYDPSLWGTLLLNRTDKNPKKQQKI